MKRLPLLFLLLSLAGCSSHPALSKAEKELITGSPDVMRVLTVEDRKDSLFLRKAAKDFSDKDLKSEEFKTLARKMVRTVTDPSQDGVGIAGPQVGIRRRIVAVQRFDKPDEPFEVYANVRIDSLYGPLAIGQEGCLSVPGKRGTVPRWTNAVITYRDPATLKTVRDTVSGFTAVIFQHETDHLDGILYTDKADSLFVR